MSVFGNLDWTDGQHSVPGIYPILYFVEKSKITAWPTLSANPATAEDEVTYQGDFTLAAQAVWKEINCIDLKSEPVAEPQGEIRCVSVNNRLTIVTSLTNAEAAAFQKIANNTDLVYIFRERDSGKYRVCGSEMFTTFTRARQLIGSNPTGERGTTIEVESTDIVGFPFYEGAIITSDGDQNPGGSA